MKVNFEGEATTFGDWAYIAIAKHFQKVLRHEPEVLKDKDPEELHQMRVGMRRLRSAISGFFPALDLPKNAADKPIAKVARVLGKLRDLDVLEESLKSHYLPELPPPEQKDLELAIAALNRQRKQAFKQVKSTLKGKVYQHLKQDFQTWLANPRYQAIAEISIHNILPDLLLPQVGKLLLHAGWMVGIEFERGKPNFPNGMSQQVVEEILERQGIVLHDLRKEAKRSRYNLELFLQFYGDTYQGYVQDVKAIQTVLGDIQDCFVLAEFLNSIFEIGLTEKMPTLSAILTATRYQKWQEWEKLQRQFLSPQIRKDLHLAVLHPTLAE